MPATSEKGKGKSDSQGKLKKKPDEHRNSSKLRRPMLQTDKVIIIPDKSDSSDVILISTSPSSSESDLPTVSKVLKRSTPSPRLSEKLYAATTIKASRKTLSTGSLPSKIAGSHKGGTKSTVESKPRNPIILDDRGAHQKRNSLILAVNKPIPPKKDPALLADDKARSPRKQKKAHKMRDGDDPQHGLHGTSLTGGSDIHHLLVGNSNDLEPQKMSGTASRLTTRGNNNCKMQNKTMTQRPKTAPPQSSCRNDPKPQDGRRKPLPSPTNSAPSHSHAASKRSEGGIRRSTNTAKVSGSIVGQSNKPTGTSLHTQTKSLSMSLISHHTNSSPSCNLSLKNQMSHKILPPHMAFPNAKFIYRTHSSKEADCATTSAVDYTNFPRVKSLPLIPPPSPSSRKLGSPSISAASKSRLSPTWTGHFTATCRSPPRHSSQKATSNSHLSPTQYKKSPSPVAARTTALSVGSPPSQKLSVSATSRDDPSRSLSKKRSSKSLPVVARTRSPSLTSPLLPSSQKLGAPSFSIPSKDPVSYSSPAQQRNAHFLKKNKSTSNPPQNRTGNERLSECSKLDVTGSGKAPQSSKPSRGSRGDSCKWIAGGSIVIKENSSKSGLSLDQFEDLDEIESGLTTISVTSSSDWSSIASDSETDCSLHSVSFHPSSGRKRQTARKSTGGKLSMHRIRRKMVARGFDLKLDKIKVSSRAVSSSSTNVNASASGLSQQVETKRQVSHLPTSLPGNGGHSQQPLNTTVSSLLPGLPLLQSRKRKLAKRLPSMLSVSSDSELNNSKRTKFQPAGRTSKPTITSIEPGTSAALAIKKPRLSELHPPSTSGAASLRDCKESLAVRNPTLSDSHPINTPSASSGGCKSDSIAAAAITEQTDPELPSSPAVTSGYESDSLAIKKPRLSQPDIHSPTPESYNSALLASKKTVFPESDLLVGSAGSICESPITAAVTKNLPTITNLNLSDSCEDSLEMESTCARTTAYRPHPVPLESLTSCARTRPFLFPVKQASGMVTSLPPPDSGWAEHSPSLSEYSSGFHLQMDTESSDSEEVAQVPTKQHQSMPLSNASSLAANQNTDRISEGTDTIVEPTTIAVSCATDTKEQIGVSVASKTRSPEHHTHGTGAMKHGGGAAEGEKDQKQWTSTLLQEKDHHRSQKCIPKLSHTCSRHPLILLSHPRISLINSSEQPSASSPKSTCSFDIPLDSSPGAEGCNMGVVGTPRLLSPREEEYNQRLQDTILKLGGGGELTETPPSGRALSETTVGNCSSKHSSRSSLHSSPAAEDNEKNPPMIVSINRSQLQRQPSLPGRLYCTQPRGCVTQRAKVTQPEGFTIQPGGVLTHRLGTYVSKGVQAERGMIVDKEVLDSYLAVKLNEALYEMKEQLQATERQVKSVIEEKERLERALREKVKLIRDLTTTGFKPIMVDQETGTEPVATATASTQADMKTISKTPRRSVKQKGVSVGTQTEDSMPRPHLPTSSSRQKRLRRMYCLQHFQSHEIEDFLRRVPPPIPPSTAQENTEPEPQDKSPVQKKSVWLSALNTETSSRCIAIRPQVRLNRALSQLASRGCSEGGVVPPLQVLCRKVLEKKNRHDSNSSKSDRNSMGASVPATAVGSSFASDDHTGWTLLGPELQGLFKQLLHLFLVLKKLPVEHVLNARVSRIVDLLGHLLSHLPFPSRHDLTEAARSVDDAQKYRTVGVSTWLFGFKLKELLQILESVKMDSSRLPAYFRAEILQLKWTTSNALNFAVRDLRHITVLHDASGCEVLSSVVPPPFHSDQLPIPPLPPMDNLLCDDLDDLDSSSSLSSLGSSESEEDEEEEEGPYTASRVTPIVKSNTRHGYVRHPSAPLSLKTKHPPVDAPLHVSHTHRTPPSTSAHDAQSPATRISRMTPQQGQSTLASLSPATPTGSHSEASKTKLALLDHIETQIHNVLGRLSSRSSGQLPNATNPLGTGALSGARLQVSPANMLRLNAHDILRATSEQSKDLAMTLSPTSPVSGTVCTSRIPPKQFTHITNILAHSPPSSHSPANAVPSSSNVSSPANSFPALVSTPSVFRIPTAPCTSHPAAPPHIQTNTLNPNDTRVIGSYGSQPLILSHGSRSGSLPQLLSSSLSSPGSHTPNTVPPIMMSLAAGYLARCTNSSTSPTPSTLPSQPEKTLPHSILSCPPPTLLTSTKPIPFCSISSSSSAPLSSGSGSVSSSSSGSVASSISVSRSSSGSMILSNSGSVISSDSGSAASSGSASPGSVSVASSSSISVALSGSVNRSSSGSVAVLPATNVTMVSRPSTSTVAPSIITTTITTTTTAATRSHEINPSTTSITASMAVPCPVPAFKVVKPSTQPNPPTTKNQARQVSHSSQAISTGRASPVNLKERNRPLGLPVTSSSSVVPLLPSPQALTLSATQACPAHLANDVTTSLAHQGAHNHHTVPSPARAQARPSHPIVPISTGFPVPRVQVKASEQGVVIKWTFSEEKLRHQTSVTKYELYAHAITSSLATPPVHQWGKVGVIKPLSLPMAVTLTNFSKGQIYLFSVRAFFPGGCSVYSEPRTISP